MTLARSLVDCISWSHPELRRLHCLLVDKYPRSKLLPVIGHDLQLSCDGLQLTCGGVTNVYCELLHRSANMALGKQIIGLSRFWSTLNHSPSRFTAAIWFE